MPVSASCVVVIPLYKAFNELNPTQLASLKQGLQVFKNRSIVFIHPISLALEPYGDWARSLGVSIQGKGFEDIYFADIAQYNILLMKAEFYKAFSQYEYLLIYQDDCWVFADELDYWCSKKIDYIGAPWPDDKNLYRVINNRRKAFFLLSIWWQRLIGRKKDWRVGNGGFALHHIKNSIAALERHEHRIKNFYANEDLFWGVFVPLIQPSFSVPDSREAMAFSIEQEPEHFFSLNNQKLPFGCHAWHKYNPGFWRQWIKYDVS